MKQLIFITFCCLLSFTEIQGQISHGGQPLFLTNSILRNAKSGDFIDMPSFNVEEMLNEDHLNEANMRGSVRFAKKFFVNIEKGKDGENFILPDGTKVWRVGIRSKDAYSINVLFGKYDIPEGAKLFLYNAGKTHVIGAFTHENNSENHLLPIRPVEGDEIIIEYSEPVNASFRGELQITEVNHDYRGILRNAPGKDIADYSCMPDALCRTVDNADNIRATVMLMINGNILCSGTMVDNASGKGSPYLLTAVHCLHYNPPSFPKDEAFYVDRAGTIVSFFNYNRPACGTNLYGTEEMSLAGAKPATIIEKRDIALLRLNDTPPSYFQPYYAGLNMDETGGQPPYVNLHHPAASVKKYGKAANPLILGSFGSPFESNVHWLVQGWETGSTHAGSSGSPLFDKQGLIVGTLSGGASVCNGTNPGTQNDYFTALFKSWNETPDHGRSLKANLDPDNSGVTQYAGRDPYGNLKINRVSNAHFNNGDSLVVDSIKSAGSGYPVFGYNSSTNSPIEFAEEFHVNEASDLLGAYLLIPKLQTKNVPEVKIRIYTDLNSVDSLKAEYSFYPQYTNYVRNSGFTGADKVMSSNPTESFIRFDNELPVYDKFYISYRIISSDNGGFALYNAYSEEGKSNTAWIKDNTKGWTKASEYLPYRKATSLAIQALLKPKSGTTGIDDISWSPTKENGWVKYNATDRQLLIDAPENESGHVEIYSVTGQLINKFTYSGKTYFTILSSTKGSIGIVRVLSTNYSHASKIVF